MSLPALAKVVRQVNDVDWQQSIVLTKLTTKPISGADEVGKPVKKVRTSGVDFYRKL